MTYTIETYRRRLNPCHSPRDFLLFVAFFPQLLAGPINRAVDLSRNLPDEFAPLPLILKLASPSSRSAPLKNS